MYYGSATVVENTDCHFFQRIGKFGKMLKFNGLRLVCHVVAACGNDGLMARNT
ncbi:MAG: hypothetical protein Q4D62_07405 [Planctomycetia bacterium]|nr:hypothetical protein [Planctomycetia bacterium]